MKPQLLLTINPAKITIILLCILTPILLAHIISLSLWYNNLVGSDNWPYISIFDLDEEESIGTWFNAFVLLFAGQLLLLIAFFYKQERHKYGAAWLLLAAGFHLLSLDEIAGFHELANTVLTTHWTIFGLTISIVIAIFYLRFLFTLPLKIRWLFIISGLLYVGGAVGVEWGTLWYEENDQLNTLAYNLWNAVEEGLEMLGIILFIYSLLDFMVYSDDFNGIQIRFKQPLE